MERFSNEVSSVLAEHPKLPPTVKMPKIRRIPSMIETTQTEPQPEPQLPQVVSASFLPPELEVPAPRNDAEEANDIHMTSPTRPNDNQ